MEKYINYGIHVGLSTSVDSKKKKIEVCFLEVY